MHQEHDISGLRPQALRKHGVLDGAQAADLVSVVVPVYNCRSYVGEAVTSILAQTYGAIECIVVDDGSTDDSGAAALAVDPGIRVIRTQNRGVARARNEGLAAAQGPLVAFLDADDTWDPCRVTRGMDTLRKGECGAVLCASVVVDEDGTEAGVIGMAETLDPCQVLLFQTSHPSSSSNLLAPTGLLKQLGGFDPDLSTSADWDLTLRLAEAVPVRCIPEPLTRYRRHSKNMSRDLDLMAADMRLAFVKAFSRRRDSAWFRRRAYGRLFRLLAGSYRDEGRAFGALRYAAWSAILDPRSATAEIGRRLTELGRHKPRLGGIDDR